ISPRQCWRDRRAYPLPRGPCRYGAMMAKQSFRSRPLTACSGAAR
ncbi:uncharacterized protein METZ01_LOCUS378672, partial [marine metagenome]